MNILASYVLGEAALDGLIKPWRGQVLLDSGAFTAHTQGKHISLKRYTDYCLRSEQFVDGYIQLDVVGSKDGTRRNLDAMIKAGARPVPVLTTDENTKRISELLDVNEWVCVAGGPFMSTAAFLDRARSVARAADASGKRHRLHGLGCTRFANAIAASGLKTVDSVSWIVRTTKFGITHVFDTSIGSCVGVSDRKLALDMPSVRVANKRTVNKGANWRTALSVVAYLRMHERLRRRGVDKFFAIGNARQCVDLTAAAMSVTDCWGIDWSKYVGAMEKLIQLKHADVCLAAEEASLRLREQKTA